MYSAPSGPIRRSTGRNQASSVVKKSACSIARGDDPRNSRPVAMNAAGHHIAHEQVAVKFVGKLPMTTARDAGDARRSVLMSHQVRCKPEPIVRLAKAGIVTTSQ